MWKSVPLPRSLEKGSFTKQVLCCVLPQRKTSSQMPPFTTNVFAQYVLAGAQLVVQDDCIRAGHARTPSPFLCGTASCMHHLSCSKDIHPTPSAFSLRRSSGRKMYREWCAALSVDNTQLHPTASGALHDPCPRVREPRPVTS